MTIVQQPSALNLSGNLPDFILEDVSPSVTFQLFRGADQVLNEVYYPDSKGRVRVKLSDLINQMLDVAVPDFLPVVFHQENAYADFSVVIDSGDPIPFRVIKGFLQRAPFDVDQFLSFNWLTTQPITKLVKFHDPEWLTCYPTEHADVLIRATFANGSKQTITYTTLEPNKVQSINLNPGTVIGLFDEEPIRWEVFTIASGQQRQYVQTYRYEQHCDEHEDIFVFENRLGGVDTIRFIGRAERRDSTLFEFARFDEFTSDYFGEPDLTVNKNTGPLTTVDQRNHALDFFRALRKHHLVAGFIAGIYMDAPTLTSVSGQINTFEFDFKYSDFKIAYPEIATPPQLLELP